MNLSAASAAACLLLLALFTCVLRDQAAADAYRLASCRVETDRLESRLSWLEVGLTQELARLGRPAPDTTPEADAAEIGARP
jgi:hypothetical protein